MCHLVCSWMLPNQYSQSLLMLVLLAENHSHQVHVDSKAKGQSQCLDPSHIHSLSWDSYREQSLGSKMPMDVYMLWDTLELLLQLHLNDLPFNTIILWYPWLVKRLHTDQWMSPFVVWWVSIIFHPPLLWKSLPNVSSINTGSRYTLRNSPKTMELCLECSARLFFHEACCAGTDHSWFNRITTKSLLPSLLISSVWGLQDRGIFYQMWPHLSHSAPSVANLSTSSCSWLTSAAAASACGSLKLSVRNVRVWFWYQWWKEELRSFI